jgi:multiple sugar transport system ATP-binding protein
MATVTLDKLCKRYEKSHDLAVDHVDLAVAHGEFMVLLGPSGCGKSTTLRMIAGLEAISAGSLAIDGRVVNEVPARDRDIAMVFQSYALYPHMTVRDNLAFGLRRRASTAPRSRAASTTSPARSASPRCSNASRSRCPAASASASRSAARSCRDPKVFLFDEPLSNLDASLRVSTRAELIRLHRRLGATMIYVTHDQVEAMTMGSRICIMNHGKVVQIGAPLEVYRRPADTFVASFLGNPPMNLVKATVENGQLILGAARLALSPALLATAGAARALTFGVRPEDLAQSSGGEGSFGAEVTAGRAARCRNDRDPADRRQRERAQRTARPRCERQGGRADSPASRSRPGALVRCRERRRAQLTTNDPHITVSRRPPWPLPNPH